MTDAPTASRAPGAGRPAEGQAPVSVRHRPFAVLLLLAGAWAGSRRACWCSSGWRSIATPATSRAAISIPGSPADG